MNATAWMRLLPAVVAAIGLIPSQRAIAQIPAFPGAEGYGAYAAGGRGGDVYVVTTLNSSGPGSFYEAVTTVPASGRTVVFAVSGPIHLAGGIATRITGSKLTIAGQTAPGDGILLKDGTLRISGDDIVIRHLRFRHGKNGSGGDCIDLDSGCANAILDHVSMAFSTDENISSFGSPPENLTLQWSLNAWGLEPHSCGGLWDQNHATCHHTLWAHHHTRNPKARPNGLLEWTNNVTFDWNIGFIMGDSQTPAAWKANVRGNYFICPPGNIRNTPLEKASLDRYGVPNFSIWQDSNLHDRDGDGRLNGTDRGWAIVGGSAHDAVANPSGNYFKLNAPVPGSALLAVEPPLLAYKKIVSTAGALRLDDRHGGGVRDEVDERLVSNLVNQARGHITSESELAGIGNGGFGTFLPSTPPIDSDRDGMPDVYELAVGSNPAMQDHNAVVSGASYLPAGSPAGYTRLEEYLHFKAVPHRMVEKATATDPGIDLMRYSAGFNESPVFTVSNVTGGTVSQSGDGGRIVRFTAGAAAGRGGFSFTVTDASGASWTRQFAICITQTGDPADLKWRGSGAVWDTGSSHWLKGGQPAVFVSGDRVTFDEGGAAAAAVSVPGAVTASSIDVDGAANYGFSGAGSIGATLDLTKLGSGTLTLGNTGGNSFRSIQLQSGSLALNHAAAGGSARIAFNGGSLALAPASNATVPCAFEFNRPAMITVGSQHTASGAWSGSQTVTVRATSSQLWTIAGGWSGFSGRIVAGTGNPRIRLNGNTNVNFGSTAVAVDLGSGGAQLMNRNGATIDLGALSASGTSTVLSGTQTGTAATTYRVGALGTDEGFAGSITDGGGSCSIVKNGGGSWTLGGTSTHTGTTTVAAGELILNGSFVSSPVVVQSGATLGGSGSAGGLVTVAGGGTLAPGAPGAAGTFTAAAGLTLGGTTTLDLDLSSSPTGGNDRIQVGGGLLTLSGATLDFNLRLSDGVLGSGTYPLIAGSATMAANPAPALNLKGMPSGTRQTFSLQRQSSGGNPAFVNLVVGGNPPASLVWTGTVNGGRWDLNSSGNFNGGPTATFFQLDGVTFNDSATVGAVVLDGILQPRAVNVVNSARAYTFSGTGSLTGDMALVKSGNSTLTIAPAVAVVSTTTTTGSVTASVVDASGLAVGMAALGGGFPSGTTVVSIAGTTLTFSAASNTTATANVTYQAKNRFTGGTVIQGGTVQLANEAANRWGLGTGRVTFEGGQLRLYDFGANFPGSGDFPNPLHVAAGRSGTLYTPQRGSLSGALTGEGTLQVVVKYVRGDFYGDWSDFGGTLQIRATTGSEFRIAESYAPDGFPAALVDVGDGVTFKHVGILSQGAGTTIEVGALSGSAGSMVTGGVTGGRALTYRVGGKGVDAVFSGRIVEQSPGSTLTNLVKTGGAVWTLAGNSAWGGGTVVEAGTLRISGSSSCAGAARVSSAAALELAGGSFSADAVSVSAGGVLRGHGTLDCDLNLGGLLEGRGAATGVAGTLAIEGGLVLGGDAVCRMRVGPQGDRIQVAGDLSLGGVLEVQVPASTGHGRHRLMSCGGALSGAARLVVTGTTLPAKLATTTTGEVDLVIDDQDEDGLPDSWETAFFGNLGETAAGDRDGDGTSHLVEQRLGLDPVRGSSAFRVTLSGRTLRWPSRAGCVFEIERSRSLASGSWTRVATVTAVAGDHTTFTDSQVPAPAFYRIRLVP